MTNSLKILFSRAYFQYSRLLSQQQIEEGNFRYFKYKKKVTRSNYQLPCNRKICWKKSDLFINVGDIHLLLSPIWEGIFVVVIYMIIKNA